jgi:hypothetical protein
VQKKDQNVNHQIIVPLQPDLQPLWKTGDQKKERQENFKKMTVPASP